MSKILFFDTETTGVPRDYKAPVTDSDNWPRLVQLGWIVSNANGDVIKERNYLIRPNGYFIIPEEAAKVHGITTFKANSEGHDLIEVLIEFMHDLDQVERIVGHNISFDQHVVGAELYRLKISYSRLFSLPVTCTMLSSINYCKLTPIRNGQYKWPRLEELYVKLFGHTFEGAHDAMTDITATKRCYFELVRLRLITDYSISQIASSNTSNIYTTVIESGFCGMYGALYKLLDNGTFIVFGLDLAETSELFWEFPFKDDLQTKKVILKVILNERVTHIEDFAFEGCYSLTSIEIPKTLVWIGERPFKNCISLESIVVAEDNPKYRSIDGILYSKDLKSLICCPNGKRGKVIIPDEVIEIEEGAFGGCALLTSVMIPDTVTRMGEGVFSGCRSLSKVKLSINIDVIESHTFRDCSSLETITIPKGVTWIGVNAFSGCSSLVTITIPNNVRRIASAAFTGCSSLSIIEIPRTLTEIGRNAFPFFATLIETDTSEVLNEQERLITEGKCGEEAYYKLTDDGVLTIYGKGEIFELSFDPIFPRENESYGNDIKKVIIESGITSIGKYAFQYCSNLISVEIHDGVISIEEGAFCECDKLSSVILSETITSIGKCAFENCSSLASIELPRFLTSIGCEAFRRSGLTTITIPQGVTLIENDTFRDCRELSSIKLLGSVTSIGSNAFQESGLKTISLPQTITTIGEGAFYGCNHLYAITLPEGLISIENKVFRECCISSVTIPNSVTIIGEEAFSGCKELQYVTIGKAVRTIGDRAFCLCSNITSIKIPESVISIGNAAFLHCNNLSNITIPQNVISIGGNAFYGSQWEDKQYSGAIYINNILYRYYEDMTQGTSVNVREGTTYISPYAFQMCLNLNSVTIPKSVKKIGENAFNGCNNLLLAIIFNCSTEFGEGVFPTCTDVINLDANTVGSDANNKFYLVEQGKCGENIRYRLTSDDTLIISGFGEIYDFDYYGMIVNSSTPFFDGKNYKRVIIGKDIRQIGSCFLNCSLLASIDVDAFNPDYTSIDGVLYNKDITTLIRCPEGKEKVTIPHSVTEIGTEAFHGCSSLIEIRIPHSVTRIGLRTFYGCSSLEEIVIPNSVSRIGRSAFENCTSLSFVKIPRNADVQTNSFPLSTTIIRVDEEDGFPHDTVGGKQSNLSYSLNTDGVLSISGFAEICDTIEFDKDRIKRLIISDDIICIGAPIFRDCRKLRIIEIGKSIEEIIDNTFAGCENVLSITIASEFPPIIGPHTLEGIMNSVEIRVPYDSIRYYQNARYWNEFTNIIGMS